MLQEPYNPSYIHWFGDPWPKADLRAPICEDERYHIPVPVDDMCILCREPIVLGDRGVRYSSSVWMADDGTLTSSGWAYGHAECNLRSVTGNHLHVAGMCRHRGDCNDLSGLSYREEAKLVWEMQVAH